jgi:hypothetical protein
MALTKSLDCDNTSISIEEQLSGILVEKTSSGVPGFRTAIEYIDEGDLTALVNCDNNAVYSINDAMAVAFGVNTAGDRTLILYVTEVINAPY